MSKNTNTNNRISGPEELDKILKKTNPLVWVVLGVIIALLLDLFLWAFLGTLEQKVSLPAKVSETKVAAFADETSKESLAVGQKVYIGDKEGTILSIENDGKVTISEVPVADGEYDCYVVIRQIKPINFLLDE